MRCSHNHNLPRVRRIGDDLLVARHRGVEHRLTRDDAIYSYRSSLKNLTIGGSEESR